MEEIKQYDLYNKNTDPFSYVEKVYASIWDAKNKTSDAGKKKELDSILSEINSYRQELISIKREIDKGKIGVEEKIYLNNTIIPTKIKSVNNIIHDYNIKLKNQSKKLDESKKQDINKNLESEINNVIKDNNIISNKISGYIDSKKDYGEIGDNVLEDKIETSVLAQNKLQEMANKNKNAEVKQINEQQNNTTQVTTQENKGNKDYKFEIKKLPGGIIPSELVRRLGGNWNRDRDLLYKVVESKIGKSLPGSPGSAERNIALANFLAKKENQHIVRDVADAEINPM